MRRLPQAKYTREFRQEAVKLITEQGMEIKAAAKQLSLPPSTLAHWIQQLKAGTLNEVGKGQKTLTELDCELAKVKKENATLRMENEILKKRPRTLPGSRCPVRISQATATRLSFEASDAGTGSLTQWFL
jgi:transposase-like protein